MNTEKKLALVMWIITSSSFGRKIFHSTLPHLTNLQDRAGSLSNHCKYLTWFSKRNRQNLTPFQPSIRNVVAVLAYCYAEGRRERGG